MKKITVITPSYNRAHLLNDLYVSLVNQTNKDFVWLIIDDGSSDNTKEVVNNFINKKEIEIVYVYKTNGGKHTALNKAFEMLNTELSIIVDSDDTLTSDAIEIIIEYDKKYASKKLAGYVFSKGYDLNTPLVVYPDNEIVANYNDYIINGNLPGDKCEVFKSDILSKYKFDVYDGEKFIAEGYLWSQIAYKYDMVFINKVIYLCEYLEGGLTKLGRRLRINNPKGGMRHALEYIKPCYNLKIRIKNMLLCIVYSKFSKVKFKTEYKFLKLICYFPGNLLYYYWNKKYMK